MLPNIDDLILDFEEDEQEKTQTFAIRQLQTTSFASASVLGVGILGALKLNTDEATSLISGYIGGKIDGIDALRQSIYLMLSIEADQYIIYPYTYGLNTLDLIGKPHYYVMAVLPERIKETLLSDSRILDVSDFEFEVNRNQLTVKFVAHTIYGDITQETEVTY